MGDTSTKDILRTLESKYLEKDFQGFIDQLLLNKEKFDSSIFHYNLGTLYFKKNNLGAARYHLEKALKKGLTSERVLKNLSAVDHALKKSGGVVEKSFSDSFVSNVISYPTNMFLTLTLLLFCLCLTILKIAKKFQAKFIVFICFICLSPLATKIYLNNSDLKVAIVMKETSLKEGPSQIYSESGKLSAGVKVVISKYSNGWYYISSPKLLVGWVTKGDIGIL